MDPSFTIGIEEEYQTIDPVTRDLRSHIDAEIIERGRLVLKEAVKAEIAPSDYDEHLALMAMAMDVDAIGEAVRGVREGEG